MVLIFIELEIDKGLVSKRMRTSWKVSCYQQKKGNEIHKIFFY